MKKISIVFCVILLALKGKAQNFEGEIVYKNSFMSKLPALTDDKLEAFLGTRQEYFIKDGYYKSVTNGSIIAVQIYDNQLNRLYNKRPGLDTLLWLDASSNLDSVVSYEVRKNADTILGNSCDALVLKSNTGTTTFYYSNKYKLNSLNFEKHRYGNWAFFTSKSNALPLKTIFENAQFKMEQVAVEIKPMKMEDSFFKIDTNIPMKKGEF